MPRLNRIAVSLALAFSSLDAVADVPRHESGAGHSMEVVSPDHLEAALRPTPGHWLLVHLWASWCRPCLMEWPALADSLRHTARKDLDVVLLSVDGIDGAPAARKVLRQLGSLPGRSILVPLEEASPLIEALDPQWDGALPTTLLLDADRQLVFAQRGGTDLGALEREIERAVGRSPPLRSPRHP